jgi:hypothetical protein
MINVFLAYASGTDFQETIIRESSESASTGNRRVTPWSEKDTSGQQIQKSVETWISEADAFIGDISTVNHNVTYEIGFAVGLGKPVRLIRSKHTDLKKIQEIGLLDTLGHDSYDFQPQLTRILGLRDTDRRWQPSQRNQEQPIFILYPPELGEVARHTISAVKKVAKLKFRGFNPAEISRLNASEAYEHTMGSFGVVLFWNDDGGQVARQNNQRAAFIFGLARGADIPAILLANEKARLPLDLHDIAERWARLEDIDPLINSLRENVADRLLHYSNEPAVNKRGQLSAVNFGDPVAENEQSYLKDIFVETDAFRQAIDDKAHVLVGRKGSGKSAVFLRVRDKSRAQKQNIVVDLMPEGHQLIKIKEFVLDKLSLGNRKEVVAAFWQYVL